MDSSDPLVAESRHVISITCLPVSEMELACARRRGRALPGVTKRCSVIVRGLRDRMRTASSPSMVYGARRRRVRRASNNHMGFRGTTATQGYLLGAYRAENCQRERRWQVRAKNPCQITRLR